MFAAGEVLVCRNTYPVKCLRAKKSTPIYTYQFQIDGLLFIHSIILHSTCLIWTRIKELYPLPLWYTDKNKASCYQLQMIAKGKNASTLFPAVVKNVACKNIEVKKLVYVYLERYAEEQQDLALLSISTFQRGLKVRFNGFYKHLLFVILLLLFWRQWINSTSILRPFSWSWGLAMLIANGLF